MSKDLNLIRQYYQYWKNGNFDPNLFDEDMTFRGPLAKADNFTEFQEIVKQMGKIVTVDELQFKGVFADGYGNGCAVYDFITSKPVKMKTECAELFHFEDGKIKEIRLIYDAREWEKIMQPQA